MQVNLVSKRGVPDDALISIRSGAVRRQGAISAGKALCFPQMSEGDCVVKVDIMQNIGSGYIVLRPNQTEGKLYEVILGSDEMACEIEISPTDGKPAAPEMQEDTTTAKTKQDAKAYLEGTGLLPFVQGVLQVVAKQQPQDPFAAMAKHFNSASDEAVAPTPGSPKSAPANPPAATSEKAEATKEAPTEAATEDKAAPQTENPADTADEGKAEDKEDDVDDHKSDVVEVQFTATLKGKELTTEGDGPAVAELPASGAVAEPPADGAVADSPADGAEQKEPAETTEGAEQKESAETGTGEAQTTEAAADESPKQDASQSAENAEKTEEEPKQDISGDNVQATEATGDGEASATPAAQDAANGQAEAAA